MPIPLYGPSHHNTHHLHAIISKYRHLWSCYGSENCIVPPTSESDASAYMGELGCNSRILGNIDIPITGRWNHQRLTSFHVTNLPSQPTHLTYAISPLTLMHVDTHLYLVIKRQLFVLTHRTSTIPVILAVWYVRAGIARCHDDGQRFLCIQLVPAFCTVLMDWCSYSLIVCRVINVFVNILASFSDRFFSIGVCMNVLYVQSQEDSV